MASMRIIEFPPELAGAAAMVLSPDARTVACRLERGKPGLYAYDVGGRSRPLRLDAGDERYTAPTWTESGDLLFRVEAKGGARVGVVPAFGRGSGREYSGSDIAVSADGRVLAVADPERRELQTAVVEGGNSPFFAPPKVIGQLGEGPPAAGDRAVSSQMDITRDGRYVILVRHRAPQSPSLWSYPVEGGDAQEIAPQVGPEAFISFALSRSLLAVLEVRRGPLATSRLYVRPISAGSLGAIRLGPARDLLFARHALPFQRPAFSPDGKKLAVLGAATPALPGGAPNPEMALDLLPIGGGKPVRAVQALDLRGSVRFLESGEVVVDGFDRVSVVTL
jgi:dipeptidyl aminopeptidase/acylaminoacyl peptidase